MNTSSFIDKGGDNIADDGVVNSNMTQEIPIFVDQSPELVSTPLNVELQSENERLQAEIKELRDQRRQDAVRIEEISRKLEKGVTHRKEEDVMQENQLRFLRFLLYALLIH